MPPGAVVHDPGHPLHPTSQPVGTRQVGERVEHEPGSRIALGVEEVPEPGHVTVASERFRHRVLGRSLESEQAVRGGRRRPVQGAGHGGVGRAEAVVQAGPSRGRHPRRHGRSRQAVVEQGHEHHPQHLQLGW